MIHFLPPVLMGEARQQQQVVLCWDTRTTQPCTPLVTGVVWEGVGVCGGGGGVKGVFYIRINHRFINVFKDHSLRRGLSCDALGIDRSTQRTRVQFCSTTLQTQAME